MIYRNTKLPELGFPNESYPSDHLYLLASFKYWFYYILMPRSSSSSSKVINPDSKERSLTLLPRRSKRNAQENALVPGPRRRNNIESDRCSSWWISHVMSRRPISRRSSPSSGRSTRWSCPSRPRPSTLRWVWPSCISRRRAMPIKPTSIWTRP